MIPDQTTFGLWENPSRVGAHGLSAIGGGVGWKRLRGRHGLVSMLMALAALLFSVLFLYGPLPLPFAMDIGISILLGLIGMVVCAWGPGGRPAHGPSRGDGAGTRECPLHYRPV